MLFSCVVALTSLLASDSPPKALDNRRCADPDGEIGTPRKGPRVIGLRFSPNGSLLVASYSDDTLKVWRVQDVRLSGPLVNIKPQRNSSEFSFHPDNKTVAFQGQGVIYRPALLALHFAEIDGKSFRPLERKLEHEATLETLAEPSFCFAPNGRWVAYSSIKDASIELWPYPFTKKDKPQRLSGHEDFVEAICFSKDSSIMVSVSLDATLRIWSLRDLKKVDCEVVRHRKKGFEEGYALALEMASDNRYIGVAFDRIFGYEVWAQVYDRKTRHLQSYKVPKLPNLGKPRKVCFLSNLGYLLIGDTCGRCHVWSREKQKMIRIHTFGSEITSLAKTTDESILAVGCFNGKIHLHRAAEFTKPTSSQPQNREGPGEATEKRPTEKGAKN